MLGVLALCSPSEHVFGCTLLTLQCACVNDDMPCVQVRSLTLRLHGGFIRLMAEILSRVYINLPMDFPGGSDGKVSAYNVGDPGSIPGLGRSLGEGNGNLLHYSRLENPMDGGSW